MGISLTIGSRTPVQGLLLWSGPPAIPLLVVPIVVREPVDRAPVRARSHISQEAGKVVLPLGANSYPTTAPVLPLAHLRIAAPLGHVLPDPVLSGPLPSGGRPVRRRSRPYDISLEAPARLRVVVSQSADRDDPCGPAVAPAEPLQHAADADWAESDQAVEPLIGDICSQRHTFRTIHLSRSEGKG
jgi:hypothetical protein